MTDVFYVILWAMAVIGTTVSVLWLGGKFIDLCDLIDNTSERADIRHLIESARVQRERTTSLANRVACLESKRKGK